MARVLIGWKDDDTENWAELPKSKAAAVREGSARYFTGKACDKNHVAPRYTQKGECSKCNSR